MGRLLPLRKSELRILEEHLAMERRRVVSDWRATLIFHRYDLKNPFSGCHRFEDIQRTRQLLARLAHTEELAELEPKLWLYKVTSPYAQQDPILEWEILMEANPLAAVSHYSAMSFHQLTEDFPKEFHLLLPGIIPDWFPIGTGEDDWDELKPPGKARKLEHLHQLPVYWHTVKRLQGIREYKPFGYPVRVTTVERTLLDGLLDPAWCGGSEKVFRAWANARETVQVNMVVDLVNTFDMPILRQRAGFVMETLGLKHPDLAAWATKSLRGGSSKLVADEPYVAAFSERWCLSINAPIGALEGDQS
jgi:predicted transcriptional regulator of viral defense system